MPPQPSPQPAARPVVPCAVGAGDEPLPGTAPHRPVWALVEHPGPWGRDAPLDAPWPAEPGGGSLGARLAAATEAAGVRLVLARRHRTRPEGGPPRRPTVVVARCGPGGWAATTSLRGADDLDTLDWAALAAAPGVPAGWSSAGAVWAVCTHGTRDACCARLGRPLAQRFSRLHPDDVWEISHSGGHRLAGVVLALPEGLCYGRVGVDDVDALLAARSAGAVVPGLLRGRLHLPPPLQAAEAALRAATGEAALDAFTPVDGAVRDGVTTWRGAGATWRVTVRQVALPDRPASCGKPPERVTGWRADVPQRLAADPAMDAP